jgi:Ca2+/Na+ antiporter
LGQKSNEKERGVMNKKKINPVAVIFLVISGCLFLVSLISGELIGVYARMLAFVSLIGVVIVTSIDSRKQKEAKNEPDN